MKLTTKQIKHLRALAHNLKPVVIIGAAGLTESNLNEISLQLEAHELIKVRVNAEDREARALMIEAICDKTNAVHVQTIGHIGIFYRGAPKPAITLPA